MTGEIGLGTWGLSGDGYGPVAPEEAARALAVAADEGVTFFETSSAYGEGAMETALGELLKARGRDKLLVSTRVGVDRADRPPRKRFEPGDLARFCDESLKRLGTDYVDALVLHNPREETVAAGEAIEALEMLKSAGKTRLIGVSAWTVEVGRAALKHKVDLLAVPYNLLFPKLLHQLSGEIVTVGAAVVATAPLAFGLLADTWAADRRFDDEDHRTYRWTPADIARRVRQREAARFLVRGHIGSLREAALRYVLANGLVSVVTPGARTAEHARTNAHAADALPFLPDQDLARIGRAMGDAGVPS